MADEIAIGTKVMLDRDRPGIVRYVGPKKGASGTWYGIELLQAVGKHDGKLDGTRYFYAGNMRGVMYQRDRIRKVITNRRTASSAHILDMIDPSTKLKSKSTKDWDNETVCRWVAGLAVKGDYVSTFRHKEIDGKQLLDLRPYTLMTNLRIDSKPDRITIYREIKKLAGKEPSEEDMEEFKVDESRRRGPPSPRKGSKKHSRTASNFQPTTPLTEWVVDDVVRFINGIGGKAADYGAAFRDHDVNGKKLIMLTDDDLLDYGVQALGVRKKILNSLEALVGME